MYYLMVGLLAFGLSSAHAGTRPVVIDDEQIAPNQVVTSIDFNFTFDLKNVWVDAHLNGTAPSSDAPNTVSIEVPGLVMDAKAKEVLYHSVVCAKVVGPSFGIWVTHLDDTGNCKLSAKVEDGYLHAEMDVAN